MTEAEAEIESFARSLDGAGVQDDESPEAVVATGYMGDSDAWCYWDSEYPDGSCGPFTSRAEAVAHAALAGYVVVDC